MTTLHHPCTLDIYETVMEWLETEHPPGPVLQISILEMIHTIAYPDVNDFLPARTLTFYRISNADYATSESLGKGARAIRKDGSTVDIWYRPDWRSFMEIERILRET